MQKKNWFAILVLVVLALVGGTASAQTPSQDICVAGLGGSNLVNGRCECPTVTSNNRTVHMVPMRVRLQSGNYAWGCGMPAPPRPRPRPVPGQPTPPAPQPEVINAAWVTEQICRAEGILCARDANGRVDINGTGRNVTEFVNTTRAALQTDRAALEAICRPFASQQQAVPVQAEGSNPPPAQPATAQSIVDRCRTFRDQLDQMDATLTSEAGQLANHEERIAELERRVRQLSGGISDFVVFVRNGSVNMTTGVEPTVIAPINGGSVSFCAMATVAMVAPIAGEGAHRFRASGGVGGGVGGLGGIMCAQATGGYQYRPGNSPVGFSIDAFGIGMWDPLNPQSRYGEGTNRGWAFGARVGVPFTLGDRVTLTPYIGAGYGRSMMALPQGGASAMNSFSITGGINLEIRLTR